MSLLVIYGSLINATQLHQSFKLSDRACPVLVEGYRRVFNQEPSWRLGVGVHRAVLNVVESDKDYFNGLLVNVQGDVFGDLDERERGYERKTVQGSRLSGFDETSFDKTTRLACFESAHIYIGRLSQQNDSLLPNQAYLELCLRGAKQWGEPFYRQFLQTTYVGDRTLEKFLQEIR